MAGEFVHLHVHTQYSTLDGALKVKDLLKKASGMGMPAVAITDHANMFGAIQLYKYAKEFNVKPIVGCEINVARGEGRPGAPAPLDHLLLLAASEEGYHNLVRIVSAGHTHPASEAAPSVRLEKVAAHTKGVVCLTACMGGLLQQRVLEEGREAGLATLDRLREMFEPGHLFVELQDHGFPEQTVVNGILADLAARLELPLVGSNDCHFKSKDDGEAQLYLQCIQTGRSYEEARATHHGSFEMYLKSPEEMRHALRDYPQACDNTLRVAELCTGWKLKLGHNMLPSFPVPEGFDAAGYFRHVAREGLDRRFKEFDALKKKVDVDAYRRRLEIELDVICKMQFPGYFLIVWDFIRHAKEHGIPVGPGRGSGAGSLVAYSMRITDLDPLPFDLLFERFLNPERVSMPDFDVDFCMDKRDRVIGYVAEKYGRTSVGQIATFHELKARSVIKDVARAMQFEPAESAKIASLIPMKGPGATYTIPEMVEQNIEPKFTAMMDTEPRVKELVQQARKLEGLTRHAGMHAAGVVISEGPLWDHVPVFVNGAVGPEGPGPEAVLVTQYYKEDVELAGLVKFDFLGLKTLTVLDIAVHLLVHRPDQKKEEPFDISAILLDDKETYDLLSSGETIGVFQLESSGMQKLFQDLKPDCFEDIVAAVALYRPGPLETGMVKDFVECKHGRQPIKKMHALIDELLRPTYGVIVYQEQVMQIAQKLSGYTLGGADLLRRAMGKKKPEEMAKQKSVFVDGAVGNGVVAEEAATIFDLVEKFAGYGFNKCLGQNTPLWDASTGERTTVGELFRERRPFTTHSLGSDGKLRARRVLDVVWNGYRQVYRLRTRSGRELTATDNHPFRTLEGWTNLGELKAGDRVAAPRELRVEGGKSWPAHELIALAGLLSEGNTCHPSCLYFFGNERSLVEDFAAAAARFPDSSARVTGRADGRRLEVCVSTGRDARFKKGQRPWNARPEAFDGAAALELADDEAPQPRRSGAFEWALGLGIVGKKATEKSVPPAVFTLCDGDIALFIGRLWSGDGFFANRTNFVPFYATSSPRLAEDVRALLLRLGILSSLHRKSFKYRGGVRPGYTVHLLGEGVERFMQVVAPHCVGRDASIARLRDYLANQASGQSCLDTLPLGVGAWMEEDIAAAGLTLEQAEEALGVKLWGLRGRVPGGRRGFRRELAVRVGELVGSRRLIEAGTSDIFWDEVVSVEPAGTEDVYDLEVEGDHNFVADGLIVHNSHSAAYALITYQTGYLKAHYPVEFFCALMTADKEKNEKVVRMIAEARSWGVQVLPPDINESLTDFKVVYASPKGDFAAKRTAKIKDKYQPMIRFGLGAIKGIGESALDAVFEARASGNFIDMFDFASRVDARRLNRGVFEALVQCGAFDSTFTKGISRAQAFKAIDLALDRARNASRDRERGQTNLFDLLSAADEPAAKASYPASDPWDLRELLKREKESLGFYVSGHPLDRYGKDMGRFDVVPIASLATRENWSAVKIAGMVENYKEKIPKGSKTKIAFFDLEDATGRVGVKVRDRQLAELGERLTRGEPLLLSGKLSFPPVPEDTDEGDAPPRDPTLLLNDAQPLSDTIRLATRSMIIRLSSEKVRREQLAQLNKVLRQFQGVCPVQVVIELGGEAEAILALPTRADPGDEVLAGLERIFGEKVVELY